jgi:hypothetical protein
MANAHAVECSVLSQAANRALAHAEHLCHLLRREQAWQWRLHRGGYWPCAFHRGQTGTGRLGFHGQLSSISAPNGLPREDLALWVAALAPPGAAALRCHPYGVRFSFDECVMPLTTPMPVDHPGSRRATVMDGRVPATDWLYRVLARVTRDGRPLKPAVIERLVVMLAPGPRRRDGLPAHWPAPNIGQTQAWAGMRQRDGSLGRAVLTAVAVDLQGHSVTHVSAALLRLHDHEKQPWRKPGRPSQDGYPRGAHRYLANGRSLLAIIGAWPWTHAPAGRLPAGWRYRNDFVEPLRLWHEAAVAELEHECQRTRATLARADEWPDAG